MKNEIKFIIHSIKKNIQSSAELRTSFLTNIIGMTINNFAFVFLWINFVKSVGIIGGWTIYDVIRLNGFTSLSFGLIFSVFNGIRKLPTYVSTGSFDRFMLSPKNILARIATSTFYPSAVGDIIFGIVCLAIYGFLIKISILQIIFLIILLIFSSIIFLSLAIIIFSLSFYFVDADSVTDGTFQLFFTPSLFHGGSFQGVMRFAFTFIIPSLLVASIPIETIKSLSGWSLFIIAVLSTLWFMLSIKFFYRAVRRYESSNFMTFGN